VKHGRFIQAETIGSTRDEAWTISRCVPGFQIVHTPYQFVHD
jgi:hypothetical protein